MGQDQVGLGDICLLPSNVGTLDVHCDAHRFAQIT